MIILTPAQWSTVRVKILARNPPSILLIRDKCRRELGFTTRTQYAPTSYLQNIHLDFYDDALETFFIMQYM
jgi:hypothetical protein